jgi:hypothetical protein
VLPSCTVVASCAQVSGPTIASAVRPFEVWNARTWVAVFGPKMPSAVVANPCEVTRC